MMNLVATKFTGQKIEKFIHSKIRQNIDYTK